jgi:hypothetical protein
MRSGMSIICRMRRSTGDEMGPVMTGVPLLSHPEAPEFLFSMVRLPTEAEKVGLAAPIAAGLASA